MKSTLIFATALCVSMIAACDRRADPENLPTPEPAAPAAGADAASGVPADMPSADMATPNNDDSLALGLLGAVNEHEIAAARQAKGKNVSAPVMAYASMMESEHSANQAKTQSLGTLAVTDEVQAMKAKGNAALQELDKKSGKDYEAAYVDAMVKDHTEALSLIDSRLLTLASADPVKQHLTETRGHVAAHLQAAQELKSKL